MGVDGPESERLWRYNVSMVAYSFKCAHYGKLILLIRWLNFHYYHYYT